MPDDDDMRGRVQRWAVSQVVLGSLLAAIGIVGFFVTRDWKALGLAAVAVGVIARWSPVRRFGSEDDDRERRKRSDNSDW